MPEPASSIIRARRSGRIRVFVSSYGWISISTSSPRTWRCGAIAGQAVDRRERVRRNRRAKPLDHISVVVVMRRLDQDQAKAAGLGCGGSFHPGLVQRAHHTQSCPGRTNKNRGRLLLGGTGFRTSKRSFAAPTLQRPRVALGRARLRRADRPIAQRAFTLACPRGYHALAAHPKKRPGIALVEQRRPADLFPAEEGLRTNHSAQQLESQGGTHHAAPNGNRSA